MFRIFICDEIDGQIVVQNGLTMSAAQYKDALSKGKAMQLPEMPEGTYFDGTEDANLMETDIPLERQNLDMNEVWLAEQAAKEKFNNERISQRERKKAQKELEELSRRIEEEQKGGE